MEGDSLPTTNSNREAAIRTYQGYRYTVVTIANSAVPETIEAELWYLDGEKWRYFRRCTATPQWRRFDGSRATSRSGPTGGWRPTAAEGG